MLRLPVVERVGVVAVLIDTDGAVLAGERVDKLALVVHELEGNDVVAFVVFAGRHLSGHLGNAAVFKQRSRVGDDDAVLAARDDGAVLVPSILTTSSFVSDGLMSVTVTLMEVSYKRPAAILSTVSDVLSSVNVYAPVLGSMVNVPYSLVISVMGLPSASLPKE